MGWFLSCCWSLVQKCSSTAIILFPENKFLSCSLFKDTNSLQMVKLLPHQMEAWMIQWLSICSITPSWNTLSYLLFSICIHDFNQTINLNLTICHEHHEYKIDWNLIADCTTEMHLAHEKKVVKKKHTQKKNKHSINNVSHLIKFGFHKKGKRMIYTFSKSQQNN